MTPELTIQERLGAAFLAAFSAYPYFASGLAILVRRLIEIPSATMAVTRDGILLIDPRFVAKYEVRQLAEVLVHELQHLIRDHGERSDLIIAVDRRRWNVAADCEINCGLRVEHLPGEPCLPIKFNLPDGLLAEEYYAKLPVLSGDPRRRSALADAVAAAAARRSMVSLHLALPRGAAWSTLLELVERLQKRL